MSVHGPGEVRTPRAWRRLIVALTLALAIAVVVAIVVLTAKSPGASSPNDRSAAAAADGATTVQRRNLVETDTESGTLSYPDPQTVYNRLSGTITWLPAVGQLIDPGYVLFRVDNQPVLLLDGPTPAYRTLDADDSPGPDILELNAELVQLGYDPDGIVVDDEWQPATTDGVDDLQYRWGETETGELTLGQVVFLPGPQLVSTVDGTVGSTGGGGGAADTALIDPAPKPVFVSLTSTTQTTTTPTTATGTTGTTTTGTTTTGTTTTGTTATTTTPTTSTPTTTTGTTPTTTSPAKKKKKKKKSKTAKPKAATTGQAATQAELAALEALLRAETAELAAEKGSSPNSGTPASTTPGSTSPASTTPSKSSTPKSSSTPNSSSPGGSTGAGSAGNPVAILQTTSDHLVVTVDLAATSQSEAVVGENVTVEMPAGSTVNGRITAVSSVAQSSSSGTGSANGGSGSTPTIPVTIALKGHISGAGLDQAAVSVNFEQAKATNVLSVPVTALLATGGGNYAVQEAVAPHKLIPVTTGLFAAGYVRISGAGIYPGLQVTDSQG